MGCRPLLAAPRFPGRRAPVPRSSVAPELARPPSRLRPLYARRGPRGTLSIPWWDPGLLGRCAAAPVRVSVRVPQRGPRPGGSSPRAGRPGFPLRGPWGPPAVPRGTMEVPWSYFGPALPRARSARSNPGPTGGCRRAAGVRETAPKRGKTGVFQEIGPPGERNRGPGAGPQAPFSGDRRGENRAYGRRSGRRVRRSGPARAQEAGKPGVDGARARRRHRWAPTQGSGKCWHGPPFSGDGAKVPRRSLGPAARASRGPKKGTW